MSETIYGFYHGGDPRKFHPDHECCSPEEIDRHRRSCALWDEAESRGEIPTPEKCESGWIYDADGKPVMHVLKSSYGIGTYEYESDDDHKKRPMVTTSDGPKEALFILLNPIFRDCCDPEAVRYDLSSPFVVGEHVYATDGRIIVRSPATPEIVAAFTAVPPGDGKRLKDPALVYGPSDFQPAPLVLPDPNTFPACDRCGGKGLVASYECGECWGRGIAECNMGHEHDCDECGGKGWLPGGKCEACDGYGRGGGSNKSVEVGDYLISHSFCLLLHKHGATLYAVNGRPKDGFPPLKFTVDLGVEGRLMPMTRG